MNFNLSNCLSPSFISYLPCVSPYLKENSYEIDNDLLGKRIRLLFVIAVSSLALAAALSLATHSLVYLAGGLGYAGVLLIAHIADRVLTRRAADEVASRKYEAEPQPSKKTLKYIASSKGTLQRLSSRGVGINKPDEQGNTLLHVTHDFKNQQTLVSLGANLQTKNTKGVPAYFALLWPRNQEHEIEYWLKNNVITRASVKQEDLALFWRKVTSGLQKTTLSKRLAFFNKWGFSHQEAGEENLRTWKDRKGIDQEGNIKTY